MACFLAAILLKLVRVVLQEQKKRGRGGDSSVPRKRARLEGADTSGLGSQNPDEANEEEEQKQSKQTTAKDRSFSFKVMVSSSF